MLLVRHGTSSHHNDGKWLRSHAVGSYEDAYDAAGIRDDSHPPDVLRGIAEGATLASSNMKRAIASIERLAPGRSDSVTPLLRELRLEPPHLGSAPSPDRRVGRDERAAVDVASAHDMANATT